MTLLLIFVGASLGWFGNEYFTEDVVSVPCTVPVLVETVCTDLTPLDDATFGSTAEKLKEVSDKYYNCKRACTE